MLSLKLTRISLVVFWQIFFMERRGREKGLGMEKGFLSCSWGWRSS